MYKFTNLDPVEPLRVNLLQLAVARQTVMTGSILMDGVITSVSVTPQSASPGGLHKLSVIDGEPTWLLYTTGSKISLYGAR